MHFVSSTDLDQDTRKNSIDFHDKVDADDELWIEYLKAADEFDGRLVESWNGIIDSILIFVGLFISILTAYIIDTSKDFHPQPEVVSNQLLELIYLQLRNSSTSFVDPKSFSEVDSKDQRNAFLANFLLHTSLSLSIVMALAASAAKLWLIRYNNCVTAHAPPYDRAMRRHSAYTGLLSWKFWKIIEALPVITVLSVILFAIYIFLAISNQNVVLGYIVATILGLGFMFLIVSSSSGAFIPNSPFKSSVSELTHGLYRIFPPYCNPKSKENSVIIVRGLSVLVTSVGLACLAAYLLRRTGNILFLLLFAFPAASTLAVTGKFQERDDMKPQLYGHPHVTLFLSIILAILLASSTYLSIRGQSGAYIATVCVAVIFVVLSGFCNLKISRNTPNTAQTEAAAWMLKQSSTRNQELFKRAVETTRGSEVRKAILMKDVLPLLTPLITSLVDAAPHGLEKGQQDDNYERLHTYLACLGELCDYTPEDQTFWKQLTTNQIAFRRPHLSSQLAQALELWSECECDFCGKGSKGLSKQAKKMLDFCILENRNYMTDASSVV